MMANSAAEIQKVVVTTFLLSSMFATGLELRLRTLVKPLGDVRWTAFTLVLNFVVAPAFAWALTRWIALEPAHAVGLLLLGGAAGAPFLPKLVDVARANTAQAVTYMVLLTVGTIVFMSFVLPTFVPGMPSTPRRVATPLVLTILTPLAVGMLSRALVPLIAAGLAPIVSIVANASLIALFLVLLGFNGNLILGVIGSGAILAAALFFIGLLFLGWIAGCSDRNVAAVLALSTTARNFGAALVPAGAAAFDPKVTVMIIVGAIVCLLVSFSGALLLRGTARPPLG